MKLVIAIDSKLASKDGLKTYACKGLILDAEWNISAIYVEGNQRSGAMLPEEFKEYVIQ
jgi:hypothetical protein